MKNYSFPIDQLLNYGDCRNLRRDKTDYLSLGLSAEHIPELIQMATDHDLLWADSDSLEVWAPTHAWRTLGQLRAVEAVQPLLDLLDKLDEDGDEWFLEEMPDVFGQIGPGAFPILNCYVNQANHRLFAQCAAINGIREIGLRHAEMHEEAGSALVRVLENYAANDQALNAFIISDLTDLQADEALPLMRKAYEALRVDETFIGWRDIIGAFELPPNEDDPLCDPDRRKWFWDASYGGLFDPQAKAKRDKTKSKHKQAKASRKRNRRRK